MPLPKNSQAFGTSWKAWWQAMQPVWRSTSLSRDIPSDADWSPLLCGGANGLLLIVLALAWWIQADSKNDISDDHIADATEDVCWVLGHLKTILVNSKVIGKKRKSDRADEPARKKRYDLFILVYIKANSNSRATKAKK